MEEGYMSHNIEHRDYPVSIDRVKVKAELDDYVAHEDWGEGCSGLYRPIRWLDGVAPFEDSDAASQYLDENDKGDYDNLAVRYYSVDERLITSAKLTDLVKRRGELAVQRLNKNNIYYPDTVSAAYIGCKKCGSKLSREWLQKRTLRSNKCPVCGCDFRSETMLKAIRSLDDRINKIDADIEAERAKIRLKLRKKGEVRWLVKFEYHT
jgi:hypothetical protein